MLTNLKTVANLKQDIARGTDAASATLKFYAVNKQENPVIFFKDGGTISFYSHEGLLSEWCHTAKIGGEWEIVGTKINIFDELLKSDSSQYVVVSENYGELIKAEIIPDSSTGIIRKLTVGSGNILYAVWECQREKLHFVGFPDQSNIARGICYYAYEYHGFKLAKSENRTCNYMSFWDSVNSGALEIISLCQI